MMVRGLALIVSVCLCAGVVAVCHAYPSFYLPFEKLAEAPVIITCLVQETSSDPSESGPKRGVVAAHAMLLVLRSFNQSAVVAGERIRLDYEALPPGAQQGGAVRMCRLLGKAPYLRELRAMLESRSPGSLFVAFDILIAGQKAILGDATALALHYLSAPGAKPSDRRVACWVVRDFGTDEQFGRLVSAIKQSQYEDRHRYDELWSATIWSDNNRENEVLEILLADQRVVQGNHRYSDIARGELARIKARK